MSNFHFKDLICADYNPSIIMIFGNAVGLRGFWVGFGEVTICYFTKIYT